ncbi:MAG: hypothetical protein WC705_00585 [Candidatus Paceibacterota bacterium]|jgi:hypothetical protein
MTNRIIKLSAIFTILCFSIFSNNVVALDATSTSFFVRQLIDFIGGSSTSTTFKNKATSGGVGAGISTSSSFLIKGGNLPSSIISIRPVYEQTHFHWRNDDGNESVATSATGGSEDTTFTDFPKLTAKRLRMEIANTGGTIKSYTSQQFRLEYALEGGNCSSASYTDIGAVGGDFDMSSSQLTDTSDTTNVAVSTGGVSNSNNLFLSPNGGQRETTSQTGSLSVSSNQFVEIEYAIQALSAATDGAIYCFRVTNASSPTDFVYTRYAKAIIASGAQTLSFSISDNTIGFGNILSSASSYATGDGNGNGTEVEAHNIIASTNATNGYVITINGTTLTYGTRTISAIGGTNSSPSVGNEQFGLRMTTSGGDGTVSAPYLASGFVFDTANFPDEVASDSNGNDVANTYSVRYLSNISNNTEGGNYSAILIYTAVAQF